LTDWKEGPSRDILVRVRNYRFVIFFCVVSTTCIFAGESRAQDLTEAELDLWIAYTLDLEHRVAQNQDNVHLLLRLADAYARVGDLRRALPAHDRLAEMGVAPARITLLRGDAFLNAGDYDQAVRSYLEVLSDAPRQSYALTQLWRAMLDVTLSEAEVGFDKRAVIETLQIAGLYFPDAYSPGEDGPAEAELLVDQAAALLTRHRAEEASTLFMRALTLDPGCAQAFAGLARSYAELNDERAAMGASLVYLHLAPDAPDAREVRLFISRIIEETNLR